jgi:multiple sugar transport system permease protein
MDRKLYIKILRYILVVVLTLIFFFPIYWTITMSLKPHMEWTSAAGKIFWVPNKPTLSNYTSLFQRKVSVVSPLASTAVRPIFNSLIVSVFSTLLTMVVGTLAAYGISRYKAATYLPGFLLGLRMIPLAAIIVPVMVLWAYLGFVDTGHGLVILYALATLPFAVLLMKTFFDDIPKELDEAAIVDGYSNWQAFVKFVLPLAKGGIASTALFCFILNWSDFILALILTDRSWSTIPVYLDKLQSGYVGKLYGPKAALAMIAVIPPVIFGILIQKYLVRGLTFGAIKK